MSVQVQKIRTLTGHRDSVYTLEGGSEPEELFSAAGDGLVVKWNLTTPDVGELIARLPNSVYALHRISSAELLVAGNNYEGIHLLNWKEKKEEASLKLSASAIFDIKSHNDNLFVADGQGQVFAIDWRKWSIQKVWRQSEKSARSLAINCVAGHLAVGYSDFTIRIFSLDDFRLIHEFPAHRNSVFTLHYTPDNTFLISGSRDARLKVWDVSSHYHQTEEIAAHLFAVNHIAFHSSGDYFATASLDKSIKLWDARSLRLLKVIDKGRHAGHGTSVNKLLWTSFNNWLVSASDDRTLSVWELAFTP
jgi:WD40 repeat protein